MAIRPMLICGPCSAESEEQVLETARELKKLVAPDYFRAGIWKPRTRPDSFEGVGETGLAWMKRVQDELGIPAITEVANASHVEKIAKYGFKAFWIGARTVANPFSVQEIANAAKGFDFKIFVKNPTNPDIDLWCGAIERFQKLGFEDIVADKTSQLAMLGNSNRTCPTYARAENHLRPQPHCRRHKIHRRDCPASTKPKHGRTDD